MLQPCATNSVASQSSSSGCVGMEPCAPKSSSVSTSPRPKYCIQMRFTVTRGVSGFLLRDEPAREVEARGECGRRILEGRTHRRDDAGLQRAQFLVGAEEIATLKKERRPRLGQFGHHHLLALRRVCFVAVRGLLRLGLREGLPDELLLRLRAFVRLGAQRVSKTLAFGSGGAVSAKSSAKCPMR